MGGRWAAGGGGRRRRLRVRLAGGVCRGGRGLSLDDALLAPRAWRPQSRRRTDALRALWAKLGRRPTLTDGGRLWCAAGALAAGPAAPRWPPTPLSPSILSLRQRPAQWCQWCVDTRIAQTGRPAGGGMLPINVPPPMPSAGAGAIDRTPQPTRTPPRCSRAAALPAEPFSPMLRCDYRALPRPLSTASTCACCASPPAASCPPQTAPAGPAALRTGQEGGGGIRGRSVVASGGRVPPACTAW